MKMFLSRDIQGKILIEMELQSSTVLVNDVFSVPSTHVNSARVVKEVQKTAPDLKE